MSTVKALAQVVKILIETVTPGDQLMHDHLDDIIAVESAGARLAPTGTLQMDKVRELMIAAARRALPPVSDSLDVYGLVDMILKEHNL